MNATSEPSTIEFRAQIDLESLAYLGDHRIRGQVVFPAAAYLEMALAGAAALGPGPHQLADVAFSRLLLLSPQTPYTVRLVLSALGTDSADFQIQGVSSDKEEAAVADADWTVHAHGRIEPVPAGNRADRGADVEALRQRCSRAVPVEAFYQVLQQHGLEYGPAFAGLKSLHVGPGEAVGEVRLPPNLGPEGYVIHPALLDGALQVLAGILFDAAAGTDQDQVYLPIGVRRVRAGDRAGSEAAVHAILRLPTVPDPTTLEGDIKLFGEAGQMVMELHGLQVQRLGSQSQALLRSAAEPTLYEVCWKPKALTAATAAPAGPGRWLIFADQAGMGTALQQLLADAGATCLVASPGTEYSSTEDGQIVLRPDAPADMQRLVAEVLGSEPGTLRGVIHLWSLDSIAPEATLESLEQDTVRGCLSVLHLVQGLAESTYPGRLGLWLVTRGAQGLGDAAAPVHVGQAPLWGMAKAISMELPLRIRCVRADLDPNSDDAEVSSLLRELAATDGEDQVAFRKGERLVARLERLAK